MSEQPTSPPPPPSTELEEQIRLARESLAKFLGRKPVPEPSSTPEK
jgi:hypothetical protein